MISPALQSVSKWVVGLALLLTGVLFPIGQIASGQPDASIWQAALAIVYGTGVLFALVLPYLLMWRFRAVRDRLLVDKSYVALVAWWEQTPAQAAAGVVVIDGGTARFHTDRSDQPAFIARMIEAPRVVPFAGGRHDCIQLATLQRQIFLVPLGSSGIFARTDFRVSEVSKSMGSAYFQGSDEGVGDS